ncbi:MAG: pyridoxal biosynthesis lyase PdxS [Paraglaciecola sp.]|jgi:pyridoxal biosynthesis lyase PdxS
MLTRLLLGRRLQDVEGLERLALDNQQAIQHRKVQIKSAAVTLCAQPLTPVVAFAAGGVAGMLSVTRASAAALLMRIASLAKLL